MFCAYRYDVVSNLRELELDSYIEKEQKYLQFISDNTEMLL